MDTNSIKLQITDLPQGLLNDKAKELANTPIHKTIHVTPEGTYLCAFASVVVPIKNGALDDVYISRWYNFLNDLANKGIWQHGSLSAFSFIELMTVDLERGGAIFSFIFTRYNALDCKTYL